MSVLSAASALGRLPGRFSLLRRLRQGRRILRLRTSELSEDLKRDLGFMDGHITPPRSAFRD